MIVMMVMVIWRRRVMLMNENAMDRQGTFWPDH